MGTLRIQMTEVLPWLVRWARHASTQDFYPALVSRVQNILFLTAHYFKSHVPIAQQPGQAVVQGRLSLNRSFVPPIFKVIFMNTRYRIIAYIY